MVNNFALTILLGVIFVVVGIGLAFGATAAGYAAICAGVTYIAGAVFDL